MPRQPDDTVLLKTTPGPNPVGAGSESAEKSRTHLQGDERLRMNQQRRSSRFPIHWAYCALAALFFAPYLLGLSSFAPGDFTRHYLPYSFFQQNALLAGQLPVWNPHVNSGHPFLADTESAVFYPVSNLLLLLTSFSSTVVGRLYWLQVEALVHLVLACSFTALLVRRLTGNRMAGFAAGLVFGFSGYLTGYPPLQLGILRVAVWLPLILWLLLPSVSGELKWRRWLCASAIHAVAFFANHPQTFLFLTYAVGGWMLMLAFIHWRLAPKADGGSGPSQNAGPPALRRLLLYPGMTVAYAITLVCLTAAQLWPALEFTVLSVRSARPFHELSSGFPPQDVWQLVLPRVFSLYSPLYVGILGLGLAAVAVAALLTRRFRLETERPYARPAAIFFILAGILALLVSLGDLLPVYPFLYRFAPGWSLFRGQERVAYLVAISLAVLSGYGLALLPGFAARWRRRLGWGFFVFVLGGTALIWAVWHRPGLLDISNAGFSFHAAKSIILGLLFLGLCCRLRIARVHLIILLFASVLDLYATNFTTILADGPATRSALTRPEIAATAQSAQILAEATDSLPPRVYNEERLPEDTGMVAGWEDVWAASVLRLSNYNGFFVDFPPDRMWQLTGVGTVLTWREELTVASQLVEEFALEGETTRLHRLSTVAPRLWWARSALRVDDRTALELLADPDFDPLAEVLIADSDADALGNAWTDGRMTFGPETEASFEVERLGPGRLRVDIESSQPGLLFVSENHLPGWKAGWTAAGGPSRAEPLPIVRAHQAFLGIPVPAGSGILELAYRPASVRWGLAISAFAWLTLFVALRTQLAAGLMCAWRRIRTMAGLLRQANLATAATWEKLMTRPNESEAFRSMSKGLVADIRFQRASVLFAVVSGFALRFYQLGDQELLVYEGVYYWFSQLPPSIHFQLFRESSQLIFPASHLLNHYWVLLVGSGEFALRSISALVGTLSIPLVHLLARELRLPAFPALAATLLIAFSAYAVRSNQIIVLHSLSLTLSIAGAALAVRLFSGSESRAVFLAYVLCGAAAVYTHAFAALGILAQNSFALFLLAGAFRGSKGAPFPRPARKMLTRWVWAQFCVLALSFPLLLSAWPETVDFIWTAPPSSIASQLWLRISSYSIGGQVPDRVWLLNAGLIGSALVLASVIGALRLAHGKGEPAGRTVESVEGDESGIDLPSRYSMPKGPGLHTTVFLLLFLLMSPLAYWGPLYRQWFMQGSLYAITLPPFLLLMSVGVTRLGGWIESWLGWRWRNWIDGPGADGQTILSRVRIGSVAAVTLVLVLVAGNLYTWRNYHEDPQFSSSRGLRELAAVLERWSAGLYLDEVHILQSFPDPTLFLYYYTGDVEDSVLPRHDDDLESATEAVAALRDDNVLRIILPVSLEDEMEAPDLARQAIASSYQLAVQETVGPWLVELYSRPYPESWRLFDVEFANGLTLERAQVSPAVPPPGGQLVVHMEWSGDPTTLTGGEKVFLHLLDDTGALVAQWDPELRMEQSPFLKSAAMPVPADLPAGPLRLIAGLYDVNEEGAPRILSGTGEDAVQLVYFNVVECDACGR